MSRSRITARCVRLENINCQGRVPAVVVHLVRMPNRLMIRAKIVPRDGFRTILPGNALNVNLVDINRTMETPHVPFALMVSFFLKKEGFNVYLVIRRLRVKVPQYAMDVHEAISQKIIPASHAQKVNIRTNSKSLLARIVRRVNTDQIRVAQTAKIANQANTTMKRAKF